MPSFPRPDAAVTGFPVALLIGLAAGFIGAIPPGPINITVIRKASQGEKLEAIRVALGGAIVDTVICALIGLGFGWLLEIATSGRWVRFAFALFLVAYGLKVLLVDRKREPRNGAPPRAGVPFLVGAIQGAANPALFVNWTLVIGFLVGHRILSAMAASALGFAIGAGAGVFLWLFLLAEMVERLRNHPAGEWIRHAATVAGVLLIGFGLVFAWKTLQGG